LFFIITLFSRFTDESSSQDFFNCTTRKLSDDQSDFVPMNRTLMNPHNHPHPQVFVVLVDSEIDCNNCLTDVNHLFCDKDTFLPQVKLVIHCSTCWLLLCVFQTLLPTKPVLPTTRIARMNSKCGKGKPTQAYLTSDLTNRKRVRRVCSNFSWNPLSFDSIQTSRRRHRLSSDSRTSPQSISPQSYSSNVDHVQCHRTLSSSRGRPIKTRKDDSNYTTTIHVNRKQRLFTPERMNSFFLCFC